MKHLCYKTTSLQRPVPRPPLSVFHHTRSTSATRPPLYRDQSLNLPLVYSTTHEAPLLQDHLSSKTTPSFTHAGYRFDVKVYCNSTQLDFHLKNPLYNLLAKNDISYYLERYEGSYFLIRRKDELVTAEYLQEHGRLTEFKSIPMYGYNLPSRNDPVSVMHNIQHVSSSPADYTQQSQSLFLSLQYLKLKTPLWKHQIDVIHRTLLKEGYNSTAVAFFPAFQHDREYYFLRNLQESDYYICNFEGEHNRTCICQPYMYSM